MADSLTLRWGKLLARLHNKPITLQHGILVTEYSNSQQEVQILQQYMQAIQNTINQLSQQPQQTATPTATQVQYGRPYPAYHHPEPPAPARPQPVVSAPARSYYEENPNAGASQLYGGFGDLRERVMRDSNSI